MRVIPALHLISLDLYFQTVAQFSPYVPYEIIYSVLEKLSLKTQTDNKTLF